MAALALVVPTEVAGASVLSYVCHHVGAYAERGIPVACVVLSSTQARILFDMARRTYELKKMPPALCGAQLIIRGDLNGAA